MNWFGLAIVLAALIVGLALYGWIAMLVLGVLGNPVGFFDSVVAQVAVFAVGAVAVSARRR